jgi:hypothetical protein
MVRLPPCWVVYVVLVYFQACHVGRYYGAHAHNLRMEASNKLSLHAFEELLLPVRSEVKTEILGARDFTVPVPQLPGTAKQCFGLPAKMCKNTQDMESAEEAKDECKKMFCDPLCLRSTWKCDIDGGTGAFGVVSHADVSRALCAQFLAYGCSKVMDCCPLNDPMLHRFTENAFYSDFFPNSAMNIGACAHDPSDFQQADLVCTQCKAAVTVSFKLNNDRCADLMSSKPVEMKADETDLFHAEHSEKQVNSILEPYLLKPLGVAGTHRSLRERCRELQKEVAGKLAEIVAVANEKVCNCLGCCTGKLRQCFFPQIEVT